MLGLPGSHLIGEVFNRNCGECHNWHGSAQAEVHGKAGDRLIIRRGANVDTIVRPPMIDPRELVIIGMDSCGIDRPKVGIAQTMI